MDKLEIGLNILGIILLVLIIGIVLMMPSDIWTGNWVDDAHGKVPITKITKTGNNVRLQFENQDYTVPIEPDNKITCWGMKGTNNGKTIVWYNTAGELKNTFYKV